MNNNWVKYSFVCVLVILIQGLVVNNLEIHEFVNPMVYPMLILMLPFELNILATLIISFAIGLTMDGFSNTYGLHASASMLIAYFRPLILNYIKPRDGYDSSLLPSVHDMGLLWFLAHAVLFVFIHHTWYFSIEVFRMDLFPLILAKTFFSSLLSVLLILLLQYLFYTASRR